MFGPTVHACVDGMPAAKTFGESAPLTAMLSDIQHGVEHLQIRQPHVSTLHRQAIFDVRVLLLQSAPSYKTFYLVNVLLVLTRPKSSARPYQLHSRSVFKLRHLAGSD